MALRIDLGVGGQVTYSNTLQCGSGSGKFTCAVCPVGDCQKYCVGFGQTCDELASCCNGACVAGTCVPEEPIFSPCSSNAECTSGTCGATGCCLAAGETCEFQQDPSCTGPDCLTLDPCCDSGHPFGMHCAVKNAPDAQNPHTWGTCQASKSGSCTSSLECPTTMFCQNGACTQSTPGFAGDATGNYCVNDISCAPFKAHCNVATNECTGPGGFTCEADTGARSWEVSPTRGRSRRSPSGSRCSRLAPAR